MTEILNALAQLIQKSVWIAPLLCLAAGVITSFTPCSLSSVPVVIAYVGGAAGGNQKKAFRLSLTMALGMALTFGVFGTLASVLGHLLHGIGMWWHLAKAALQNGADLVIELPAEQALLSAEGFAKSAVMLAESLGVVDELAFGAENNNIAEIKKIAEILK